MSLELISRRTGRRAGWSRVLGLILVPLTVAGVLLWGLWNPQDRLNSVTAAVVNLDEPVELDGQLVPLGRVLAGELIGEAGDDDTENFDWVLTDEEDAAAGLDDGRYTAVVTIPENFSAAATSLSGEADDARKAIIDISESDRGRLIDTALSSIVTSTATAMLNQQLGEQFVGSVFVGMNELGSGIGEAADGAGQLASGGRQLADGAAQLADGTTQLADGTRQLADGAGSLSSGTSQLAGGVAGLSGGASQLAAGAWGLSGGANELAAGARSAAGGGAELAAGVTEYTGNVNLVVQGIIDISGDAIDPLTQVRAIIAALPADTPFPEGQTQQTVLAAIDQALAELAWAAENNPESALVQLRDGGTALAAGVQASAAGQAELATGLEGFAAGLGEYATGADALAGGVAELSTGASQLADGAAQLSAGTSELAASTPQLADGASQLADGAAQSAQGAGDLAGGLAEAAAGIPNYTSAQRDRIAATALAPVEARGASDELFNSSGVPLFAGIALWAGALALALLASPLWSRTRDAARGVGWITLRSARPAVLLGALQGLLAGIVLPIALGYDFAQSLRFFGVAVLAGVAFALVVQGFSALLGGLGRFIAFALLVVSFATGIVSTAPAGLAAIGDASPVGAALGGFQAIATGGAAGGSVMLLVLWGLGGLALTAFAVVRARRAR